MPKVKPKVSLTAYTYNSHMEILILVMTEYRMHVASTPALYLVGSEFKSRPHYHCPDCWYCGGSQSQKVVPRIRSKLF
jgi:hypothetical protein